MWCRHCQQDVPAIAALGERKFCCPRCGEALDAKCSSEKGAEKSSSDSPAASVRAEESISLDDWELDEQLHHIGQILQPDKARGRRQKKARPCEVVRVDDAHEKMEYYRLLSAMSAALERKSKSQRTASGVSILGVLTWMVLALGTAAIVYGGILWAWSVYAGRGELWQLGLPIVAGGQVALLIGLLLQLHRIWRHSRRAVAQLDDELHELKTTTKLMGNIHQPSSKAFYPHLADGANPQVLLSDLKSKLDLLAMKLSEQE